MKAGAQQMGGLRGTGHPTKFKFWRHPWLGEIYCILHRHKRKIVSGTFTERPKNNRDVKDCMGIDKKITLDMNWSS